MREEVMYGQYLDLISHRSPHAGLLGSALSNHPLQDRQKHLVSGPCRSAPPSPEADGQPEKLRAGSLTCRRWAKRSNCATTSLVSSAAPEQTGNTGPGRPARGQDTAAIALALQAADTNQRRLLHALYGNARLDAGNAEALRATLKATGADQRVEHLITERYEQTLAALDNLTLPAEAHRQLRMLADKAVWRTS